MSAKPENERDPRFPLLSAENAMVIKGIFGTPSETIIDGEENEHKFMESGLEKLLNAARSDAILARQTGEQDQGSSGGLGQPGSGSRDGADAGATAALAGGRMRCKSCNSPRAASPCRKCGGSLSEAHPDWEETRLPDIDRIRVLSREVGYSVGVHGSLERDLDLIAIPWSEGAVSPPELAAHIASGLPGRVLDDHTQDKPNGRWACNISPEGWFKMIDLSVMPPAPGATASTMPDTGTEKVAAQAEGEGSREAPTSRSQTGEPEPVAWPEVTEAMRYAFYGATEITREGAILQFEDGLRAMLAVCAPPASQALANSKPLETNSQGSAEAQARVEALEVALRAMADLYDTDEGTRSLPEYVAARALLSPSTPKPARVEITEEVRRKTNAIVSARSQAENAAFNLRQPGKSAMPDAAVRAFDDIADTLTAALNPTAPAKGSE